MLTELNIRDFALIEDVSVAFSGGLNVLTGETGAGKSIIIDALNVVLGGRVGPAVIRNGAEKASIEASFKTSDDLIAWLKQSELYDDGLDGLVVSREITKSGGRARVNGTLVNVSILQDLRHKLITIHAQHEARTLQSPQAQLEMIDALADDPHKKLLSRVKTLYAQRSELKAQLEELTISEEERSRRLDFARFQLNELEEAELGAADEDEQLSGQMRMLANVVGLESSIDAAQKWLEDGDGEGSGAIDLLQKAVAELTTAQDMDPAVAPSVEALSTCLDTLEQEKRNLRRYREGLEADPERLAGIEERLAVLATIKRKHGPTVADALNRQKVLSEEVERLDNSQQVTCEIQKDFDKACAQLKQAAAELSQKRIVLAGSLASAIVAELKDLGMPHCRFEIAVTQPSDEAVESGTQDIGPTGADKVEFLIAPNPGQPPAPVAKIASGGELSRVMLAVKSIFAGADKVATVIFDEIETGMSGRVLQTMRDKLAKLAMSHQILCITHQPLIASVADNHVQVEKEQSADATSVSVQSLTKDARLKAVASMASGQEGQKEALKFAEALFAESAKLRASLK